MANIHPEIKPNGVSDKYLIDLMYMLQQSMYGLCLKLDTEGTGLTTYVANCYTAIFHTQVWDYRGNKTQNVTTVDHIIMPSGGLSNAALIQWLYDWINGFETLVEQLDGDAGITDDNDYEDLCYEALVLPYIFESGRYDQQTILGNTDSTGGFTTMLDSAGTPWVVTRIGPTGRPTDRVLCDLLYDIINAWETLCEKIDADAAAAPPAANNYEALWYTATVLMRVENSAGNVLGNSQTRLG